MGKLIRFRRLDRTCIPIKVKIIGIDGIVRYDTRDLEVWEFAHNKKELFNRLGGDTAEIIIPAEPWWRRLCLRIRPRIGTEMEVNYECSSNTG